MKKINKKFLLISAIIAIILVIAAIFIYLNFNKSKIEFYLDDKKTNSYTNKVDYQKSMDFSPEQIKLVAKKDGKDITKTITYNAPKIKELGEYKIEYKADSEVFTYKPTIIDKEIPKITAKADLNLNIGDEYTDAKLEISAIDNFDGDISKNVKVEGVVDTKIAKDYPLTLTVKDTSNNEATLKITVHVLDKPSSSNNPPVSNPVNTASNSKQVVDPNSISVLVNKWNSLPDGWAPNDLVQIENNIAGTYYLRSEASSSFSRMMNAAKSDGVIINVVSAYRTQAYQQNLFDNYYKSDPQNAETYSARSRRSEHELGLAIDISYDMQLHEYLASTTIGQWMNENAHKYGWIMRYPEGKTDITGYMFEAWHYRYLGTEIANKVKTSGKTLEEYFG